MLLPIKKKCIDKNKPISIIWKFDDFRFSLIVRFTPERGRGTGTGSLAPVACRYITPIELGRVWNNASVLHLSAMHWMPNALQTGGEPMHYSNSNDASRPYRLKRRRSATSWLANPEVGNHGIFARARENN